MLTGLTLHAGEAVRVRIGVPLRTGCDTLGDVTVDAMPGNATDFVRISARVWKGSAACGPVQSVPRVITIDGSMLGNLELQVHDGAPGGTLALQITRQPPLSMSCAAIALGLICQNDCQCQKADGRAHCVAGPITVCTIPCNEDVDCPPERQHCHQTPTDSGDTFVCDPDLEGCCAGGCPFGEACTGCVCKSIAKPTSAGCMCDRDCGAGELCSSDHGCFVPCTDVAECAPGQNVCGGGECSSTK